MRIVIDMQGAQTPGSRTRGIGRYTKSFVKALVTNCGEHEIVLALNGSFHDSIQEIKLEFAGLLPPESFRSWYPIGPVDFFDRSNIQRRLAAEAHRELFIQSLDPDVLVVSSHFEGFGDDAVGSIGTLPANYPTCVILYDLIPLIFESAYLGDLNIRRWYHNRLDHLKGANAILAISESSRCEALRYLGFSETASIYIGSDADPHFSKTRLSGRDLSIFEYKYGINKPFVMYTGGIDHRKNVDALIRSFSKLPEHIRAAHQLAIVCSVDDGEKARLLLLAHESGMKEDALLITGFVPEDDLVALYSHCKLFVFPSLHEGFGLPVLEAMRCGAAVIASDRSSLPEIVGDMGALFDADNAKEMSNAMSVALKDPKKLAALRRNSKVQSAKFSWDATAKRAILGLENVLSAFNEDNVAVSKSKPSLAFLSPLPPAHSGIADFSAELLVHLSRYYQIDVVYRRGRPPLDARMPVSLRCVTQDSFQKNWRNYDRILYQIGNSDHHEHMLELLEETGGVAVLHDFFLSHLMEYREATSPPHNALWTELYRSHGYPALVERTSAAQLDEIVWKLPCSRSVFDWANGVVVHSQHASSLAKKWYGDALAAKVKMVPLLRSRSSAVGKDVARERLLLKRETILVCSFGMLGPSKLTHRLIEAWIEGGFNKQPNYRLVLVGENSEGEFGNKISRAISENGLNNVDITGWVEEEKYQLYLEAATMAVQLRTMSRGETSAAVLDCLKFGVPAIVNANGSMAELPPSCTLILSDEFSNAELTTAIRHLADDGPKREKMSQRATELVKSQHSPSSCSVKYRDVIERAYSRSEASLAFHRVMTRLEVDPVTMITVAERVSNEMALPERRIFLDVSLLAQSDARTGIQRVVRNLLREITSVEQICRVEACYFDHDSKRFRYARKFMATFLGVNLSALADDIIDISALDTIVFLDLNPEGVQDARSYLHEMQRAGTRLVYLVYDLIPVKHPELFEPNVSINYRHWLQIVLNGNLAICISAAVAGDLKEFAQTEKLPSVASIAHFALGSDFYSELGAINMRPDSSVRGSKEEPTFLMVGTIEPRKGYATVLDAFELLWAQGENVGLTIVGKQGWLVDDLIMRIERLKAHQPRFRWYSGLEDSELANLYATSTCLIAASLDEGFGLPLIEAAEFGLPIIARDIPVFREVGGDNAAYFPAAKGAESLAVFIANWLDDWERGTAPKSSGIELIGWSQSARALMGLLDKAGTGPLSKPT